MLVLSPADSVSPSWGEHSTPCPGGSTHSLELNLAYITCNRISQMFVCDSLEGHEDGELIMHHKGVSWQHVCADLYVKYILY